MVRAALDAVGSPPRLPHRHRRVGAERPPPLRVGARVGARCSQRSLAGQASGSRSARIAMYSTVHGPKPGSASSAARAAARSSGGSSPGLPGPRAPARAAPGAGRRACRAAPPGDLLRRREAVAAGRATSFSAVRRAPATLTCWPSTARTASSHPLQAPGRGSRARPRRAGPGRAGRDRARRRTRARRRPGRPRPRRAARRSPRVTATSPRRYAPSLDRLQPRDRAVPSQSRRAASRTARRRAGSRGRQRLHGGSRRPPPPRRSGRSGRWRAWASARGQLGLQKMPVVDDGQEEAAVHRGVAAGTRGVRRVGGELGGHPRATSQMGRK